MIDFDALFRLCSKDLWAFLRRRVASSETAADLAQEAFYRLMRNGGKAAPDDARAYLFRTAANLAIDHRRAIRRSRIESGEEAAIAAYPDPAPNAEAHSLSREELALLERAIADLPPRGREIFILHKLEGLSYGEIAERLRISKNTVMVHMTRSLAQCRAALAAYRKDLPE